MGYGISTPGSQLVVGLGVLGSSSTFTHQIIIVSVFTLWGLAPLNITKGKTTC